MEITWLGHSCIRLRSGGITLLTDPYSETLGLPVQRSPADIVTISHSHPHHSYLDGIRGEPRVIDGPGEYEIASFYISGMGTAYDAVEGEGGINTVYTLQAEGLRLCHLGDVPRILAPQQIDKLGRIDILFVPAGGACTLATSRAAELVNLLSPRIVIPIHYRLDGLKVELGPVEAFLVDMGLTEVIRESRVTVTPSSLPRDLRIVILERMA